MRETLLADQEYDRATIRGFRIRSYELRQIGPRDLPEQGTELSPLVRIQVDQIVQESTPQLQERLDQFGNACDSRT